MGALDLAGLIIIPLAVAASVSLGWLRTSSQAGRYALAVAVAVGVMAGCWTYPDPLPLSPDKHWHWLPYVGLLAAILGGAAAFSSLPWVDRKLQYFVLGGAAAFILVPQWAAWPESLPARPLLIFRVATYLGLISAGLALLPECLRGRNLAGMLVLAAIGTAALIASEVSLRHGYVSLRVAAALAGCWGASLVWKGKNTEDSSRWSALILALIPVYAVLSGGGMFIAAIEADPPKYLLLGAPAAPLLLWLFAAGPLAQLKGAAAIVAQCIVVLIVPVALLAVSLLHTPPEDEWSEHSGAVQITRGTWQSSGGFPTGGFPRLEIRDWP
jgi:hypothetical protein